MKDKISNIISIVLVYGLFSILILIPVIFSSVAMWKVFEIQQTQRIILSNQREILKNQQIVHDILEGVIESQGVNFEEIE